MNIGKQIAEHRKKNSMTQEELSIKIGVSSQTISKWENEITMPDIMLLPVIADIFDVTIDSLFKREPIKHSSLSFDELPEEAYYAILMTMQKAWNTAEGNNTPVEDGARNTAEYLKKFIDSHSMITTANSGFTYASSDIALTYHANADIQHELLSDIDAEEFLKALADENFRRILLYQVNNNTSFTVSSLCQKCGISAESAKISLENLVKYNLTHKITIELDDSAVDIYSQWGSHKIPLVCSIMRIAKALSDFKEHYRGFRN